MIFINHTEDLDNKVVVVEIEGELNSETSTDFEEYINQLLEKKKVFIILDMGSLNYISSAGIGVILYIQKKIIATKGSFIVCNVSEEISALYEILGFDKLIKIAASKEEAVKIMEKQLNLIESETNESAIDAKPQDPISINTAKNSAIEQKSPIASSAESLDRTVEEKAFEHPIILECAECKTMIRVKKSGNYICPDCKAEFLVEPDQTVIF